MSDRTARLVDRFKLYVKRMHHAGAWHNDPTAWAEMQWIEAFEREQPAPEPLPVRPVAVPAGEPIWLPEVTDDLYSQFVGETLLDDDGNWTQSTVDLACIFKAQVRASQPPGEIRDVAWLVEGRFGENHAEIRYRWMDDAGVHWTSDSHKAMRFCRRKDADMFACGDPEDVRIVEHVFVTPLTKPVE